jgi:hypothetical protein
MASRRLSQKPERGVAGRSTRSANQTAADENPARRKRGNRSTAKTSLVAGGLSAPGKKGNASVSIRPRGQFSPPGIRHLPTLA